MYTFLTNQLLPVISWTLIHSLWQGLVLTVLAGLVMLLTGRTTALLRYSLLCTLFCLFLAGVVLSFFLEWKAVDGSWRTVYNATGSAVPSTGSLPLRQWVEYSAAFLDANARWIVLLWLLLFVCRSGRMLLDMLYIRRLRSHGRPAYGDGWTCKVQTLGRELGIRKKVLLVESVLVKIPVVIGHFKPLILVPAGMLTQMPPGELEAIMLHELAHIRRHDYLVNFIQRLSELIFFFNPGLLWVSSLLRIERENCCDDVAISRTKNKAQFVEALIRCKERSLNPPGYALGLFGKKNLLLRRLTRIVYSRNQTLSLVESAFFILSLMATVLLFSGMCIAGRPVRPAAAQPLVEGRLPLHGFTTTKPATGHPPKQEITKRIKKRLRAESVNRTSLHSAGQKIQLSVSFTEVLEADKNSAENSSFAFPASNVQPVPVLKSRYRSEQEGFEALRLRAERDRKQAETDREQATRNREQAEKDRLQAEKDRRQAERDREQFARDRIRAESDRIRAEQDRRFHGYQQ